MALAQIPGPFDPRPVLSEARYHLGANILSPGLLRSQPVTKILQRDKEHVQIAPIIGRFVGGVIGLNQARRFVWPGGAQDKQQVAANCLDFV